MEPGGHAGLEGDRRDDRCTGFSIRWAWLRRREVQSDRPGSMDASFEVQRLLSTRPMRRSPLFSRLFIAFAIALAVPACASHDSPAAADTNDVGTPSSYQASDFESFDWFWYGDNVSSKFALDRDCGLSASAASGITGTSNRGTGTADAGDCVDFESFVVSPAMISAFETYATSPASCSDGTDDYSSARLTLRDGGTLQIVDVSGCSEVEPFATLRTKMQALSDRYIVDSDAGVDGG
jgi:hypothetical protein